MKESLILHSQSVRRRFSFSDSATVTPRFATVRIHKIVLQRHHYNSKSQSKIVFECNFNSWDHGAKVPSSSFGTDIKYINSQMYFFGW